MAIPLLERIQVRPPYLSLRNVRSDDPWLRANVSAEQPLGAEVGPMAGSDVARHLAILGSLAAAEQQDRDEPLYYLAHHGLVQRLSQDPQWFNHTEPLAARARCNQLGKTQASAEAWLATSDGFDLFAMQLTYRIVSEDGFEMLFGGRGDTRADERPGAFAPALGLDITDANAEEVQASFIVEPEHCAGHFSALAVLPVAVLSNALNQACARLAQEQRGEYSNVVLTAGDITAEDLAVAGQRVNIRVRAVGTRGKQQLASAIAETDDRLLTRMNVEFIALNPCE